MLFSSQILVSSLLFFLSLYAGSLSSQENDNARISLHPARGFLGDEIIARCHSQELVPGGSLNITWYVREQHSTSRLTLGECHTTTPGFPAMTCHDEAGGRVGVVQPYADGQTPFAVSSLAYTPLRSGITFICETGNELLEARPDLREKPGIENLQITCNNNQTELQWQSRGLVDYFEVNFGNGVWHRVGNRSTPYNPTYIPLESAAVRAVNDYGHGDAAFAYTTFEHLNNPGYAYQIIKSVGCRTIEVIMPGHVSFHPSDYFIFFDDELIDSLVVNQLTIRHYEGQGLTDNVGILKVVNSWDCEIPALEHVRRCLNGDTLLCAWWGVINPFEALASINKRPPGCVTKQNNTEKTRLSWEYLANHRTFYIDAYYNITVTDNSQTTSYRQDIVKNHLLQQFELEVAADHSYSVTVTPVYPIYRYEYPRGIARCDKQAITFELTMPALTSTEQLGENDVRFVSGGVSSGYRITVFSSETPEPVAFVSDENGQHNATVTGLDTGRNYTAVIAYDKTETVLCRTETLVFSLTVSPSVVSSDNVSPTSSFALLPVSSGLSLPFSSVLSAASASGLLRVSATATPIASPFPGQSADTTSESEPANATPEPSQTQAGASAASSAVQYTASAPTEQGGPPEQSSLIPYTGYFVAIPLYSIAIPVAGGLMVYKLYNYCKRPADAERLP